MQIRTEQKRRMTTATTTKSATTQLDTPPRSALSMPNRSPNGTVILNFKKVLKNKKNLQTLLETKVRNLHDSWRVNFTYQKIMPSFEQKVSPNLQTIQNLNPKKHFHLLFRAQPIWQFQYNSSRLVLIMNRINAQPCKIAIGHRVVLRRTVKAEVVPRLALLDIVSVNIEDHLNNDDYKN